MTTSFRKFTLLNVKKYYKWGIIEKLFNADI